MSRITKKKRNGTKATIQEIAGDSFKCCTSDWDCPPNPYKWDDSDSWSQKFIPDAASRIADLITGLAYKNYLGKYNHEDIRRTAEILGESIEWKNGEEPVASECVIKLLLAEDISMVMRDLLAVSIGVPFLDVRRPHQVALPIWSELPMGPLAERVGRFHARLHTIFSPGELVPIFADIQRPRDFVHGFNPYDENYRIKIEVVPLEKTLSQQLKVMDDFQPPLSEQLPLFKGRQQEGDAERWLPVNVKGGHYIELYEVSDYGRVRRNGKRKMMKPYVYKKGGGYQQLNLSRSGNFESFVVHRLVAEAFLGARQPGMHINHIDGDKCNNCLSNLEYVTPAANLHHARNIGLAPSAENHSSSKSTNAEVLKIVEMYRNGKSIQEIAKCFGMLPATVGLIVSGKRWSTITGIKDEKSKYTRRGRLSPDQVLAIVDMHKRGVSVREIAVKFEVVQGTIYSIINGRSRFDITGIKRKHQAKGTSGPTKIKPEQVRKIVRMYKFGIDQKRIAERFDVTRATVSAIVTGHTWSHISGIKWKPAYDS